MISAEANRDAPVDEIEDIGGSCIFDSEGNVRTIHFFSQVSDADLKLLSEMNNLDGLQNLTLYSCDHITDRSLEYLSKFPALAYVALPPQMTAAGIEYLQGLPDLKALALNGTTISDTMLDRITSLSELQWLTLSGSTVTDEQLDALADMPHLRILGLEGTQITDAGLKRLERCATLTEVQLSGSGVTVEGVKSFEQALPECRILK